MEHKQWYNYQASALFLVAPVPDTLFSCLNKTPKRSCKFRDELHRTLPFLRKCATKWTEFGVHTWQRFFPLLMEDGWMSRLHKQCQRAGQDRRASERATKNIANMFCYASGLTDAIAQAMLLSARPILLCNKTCCWARDRYRFAIKPVLFFWAKSLD
jgi:hypothetical protein